MKIIMQDTAEITINKELLDLCKYDVIKAIKGYTVEERDNFIKLFNEEKANNPKYTVSRFANKYNIGLSTIKGWIYNRNRFEGSSRVNQPKIIIFYSKETKERIIKQFVKEKELNPLLSHKKFAERYGIKENTLRVIIHKSKINEELGKTFGEILAEKQRVRRKMKTEESNIKNTAVLLNKLKG